MYHSIILSKSIYLEKLTQMITDLFSKEITRLITINQFNFLTAQLTRCK